MENKRRKVAAPSGSQALRTTLSLTSDIRFQLENLARHRGTTVVSAIRQAVEQYVATEERLAVSSAASQAHALLGVTAGLSNHYQDQLAAWRMERTANQVGQIAQHYRLSLRVDPPEIYLLKVLTELLRQLGDGDEFLVVTNLEFWHNAASLEQSGFLAPESAGHYLTAQREAISRGMRLYRVFLLGEGVHRSCLEQHYRFLADVRGKHASRADHVKVHFKTFRDVRDARRRIGHFACIRRVNSKTDSFPAQEDRGSMVVKPAYRAEMIETLEFFFSGNPAHAAELTFHLNQFFQVAEGSRSIDELESAAVMEFSPVGTVELLP
jgi:hypothetical protein